MVGQVVAVPAEEAGSCNLEAWPNLDGVVGLSYQAKEPGWITRVAAAIPVAVVLRDEGALIQGSQEEEDDSAQPALEVNARSAEDPSVSSLAVTVSSRDGNSVEDPASGAAEAARKGAVDR